MPENDIELALAGLAGRLAFPATPDLTGGVLGRLERPRRSRRRVLVLAFAVLLATAGVAAGVTAGLRGLGIVHVDKLPPLPPGKGVALGLRVRESEARRLVGFTLVLPGAPLGAPDAWYVSSVGSRRAVTLVWAQRAGLPPARHGVSVLVTETPGSLEPEVARKLIPPTATITAETVNGRRGIWITGSPHVLAWVSGGEFQRQDLRLIGNVLVWNRGGVLLRVEGARTFAEAQELAASF